MSKRMAIAAALVALVAATACSSSSNNQRPMRVAFLRSVATLDGNAPFDRELRAKGFVLGRNLQYVQLDPEHEVHVEPEDIRRTVDEWLRDGIDLIVALSSTAAEIAANAAPQTPVLFLVNDPVAVGLVSDPARPDRNLTGVTFRIPADRTLSLARQAMPGLALIGILMPGSDPAGPPAHKAMAAAAQSAGLESTTETFSGPDDIRRAIASLHGRGAQVVVVVNAPTSIRYLSMIEPAVSAVGLPIIANTSLATQALIVLEPNVEELLGRLGRQAARLLSGISPADIPVENPTDFRVVLNSKVAAELGIPALSTDLLRQADLVVR
ncbi:MAG: ABC transporter substrate-binding protein [Acidimicrobiales bacterium]